MSNRQGIKDKLKEMLGAYLADTLATDADGHKTIYAALRYSLDAMSPVVCVAPGGTNRTPLTARGSYPRHSIDIHVFVLYASEADGWTEENADNQLSEIEESIGRFVAEHRVLPPYWKSLMYRGESTVQPDGDIAGTPYLHEIIPLEAWN